MAPQERCEAHAAARLGCRLFAGKRRERTVSPLSTGPHSLVRGDMHVATRRKPGSPATRRTRSAAFSAARCGVLFFVSCFLCSHFCLPSLEGGGVFASSPAGFASFPGVSPAAASADASPPVSFLGETANTLSLFGGEEAPLGASAWGGFFSRGGEHGEKPADNVEEKDELELPLPSELKETASFLGLRANANGDEKRDRWFPLPADDSPQEPGATTAATRQATTRPHLRQAPAALTLPFSAIQGPRIDFSDKVLAAAPTSAASAPSASETRASPTGAAPASGLSPSPEARAQQGGEETRAAVKVSVQPHASLVQVREGAKGIGTILAGAGLNTLLGGVNQYQMGPFAPATPTAPGVMPGAAATPLAVPAAPPGGLPQMAAPPTALPGAVPMVAAAATPTDSGTNVVAITLGVIGGLVALCLVGGCVYTATSKKRKR
ncbi:hypothetical protein BESB_053490 [Besnoitia besnoiti]|uniref:Transmembrane protein n=1 Tax=Besnoitia besnoiti TaxID=94643 RepID=A0A2A9MB32_BESBE|nr:hypothetical protein BESB_053490 [Besnoitia besnoiti]PFH35698.1 hypothetical protein BESB_053490 [Besnoitia besnoiti]